MLRTIIEGEPGIFPDPVARVMRRIGGLFDRGRPAAPEPPDEPATDQQVRDEARTDEPGSDEARTDETRTDQPGSDETRTDETRTDQPRIDQPGSDEARTDGASEPRDGRHEPGAR